MTHSFLQAIGNLHLAVRQGLTALNAQEAATAFGALRNIPDLRNLTSLEDLTRTDLLCGLLFHQDRYEAVAEKLKFPESALRGIFGAETRASRMLPERSTNNRRRHAATLAPIEQILQEAEASAVDAWRSSKVRRIAPRRSEPIQSWQAQRTASLPNTALVLTCDISIHEHPEKIEHFTAQLSLKLTDWKGRHLNPNRFESRLIPGLQGERLGSLESRYEGQIPSTPYFWQAWLVMRTLALLTTSPVFTRKNPHELKSFFTAVDTFSLDLMNDLLSAST